MATTRMTDCISERIPGELTITKVGECLFQLTDTSIDSIGVCLGVFHCREAAQQLMRRSSANCGKCGNKRATSSLRNAGSVRRIG